MRRWVLLGVGSAEETDVDFKSDYKSMTEKHKGDSGARAGQAGLCNLGKPFDSAQGWPGLSSSFLQIVE